LLAAVTTLAVVAAVLAPQSAYAGGENWQHQWEKSYTHDYHYMWLGGLGPYVWNWQRGGQVDPTGNGYGPGDGEGCDGEGPGDGTGYGPGPFGPGDCDGDGPLRLRQRGGR
jgi:hypothetical protein